MADNTLHRPERVYMPGIEVEDLEAYTVGGYHPTTIKDIFDGGRYKVVHKLGWGGYSTTWLARDKDRER
jgi:serine/threonine-protein kinase SRPK3